MMIRLLCSIVRISGPGNSSVSSSNQERISSYWLSEEGGGEREARDAIADMPRLSLDLAESVRSTMILAPKVTICTRFCRSKLDVM